LADGDDSGVVCLLLSCC